MNCTRAITSGQYEGARSISHCGPHLWHSRKLQLLRIVKISVVDGQIIRYSGQLVGGQHRLACHWEWTMMMTSHSLLLWARARIAPCSELDRSWPRRFEAEEPKVFFVLSSRHRGPSNTSVRLSRIQSFLRRRLARAAMARDAKCQVAWNVSGQPIYTARPAKQPQHTGLKGIFKVSALPTPCGLTRTVYSRLFHHGILSELGSLRWVISMVM